MITLLCAVALQPGLSVVPLGALDLSTMHQDWGKPTVDRSLEGNPLRIGEETFASGLGTHAVSELVVRVPKGTVAFRAKVGVDGEVGARGTVRFRVQVDGRDRWDSGVMRGGQAAKPVEVDLRRAQTVRLIVEDAEDGIDYDHADWAEAAFSGAAEAKAYRVVAVRTSVANEPAMAVAPVDLKTVAIRGPRLVGCSAGRPFLFRIPATGRPLRFTAQPLPEGVSLDSERGILSGRVRAAGVTDVRITATNGRDTAERVLRIDARGLLALTPPMGWNSWNVWGLSVDDAKVRAAADAFVRTGLAEFGYNYVNIDDGWESEARHADGTIGTNEKFPDMNALADYVHGSGLKLGIYSSPGPRTCGGYLGSWNFEQRDAQSYADWGIDYLKYDWCSYGEKANPGLLGYQEPYLKMRDCLDGVDRDIVYSLCQYGMGEVWKWGHLVGGNLWRTTGDIGDSWGSLAGIGFDQLRSAPYMAPGRWNDPDMLIVGHVGWGPNVKPTSLKPNEQITHLTLWSMLGAPLLMGCDLTKLDDFTQRLLMNPDVIEIDQDPAAIGPRRFRNRDEVQVWARPLWDGSRAVAIFNRNPRAMAVEVPLAEVGVNEAQPIRNLWTRRNLGKGVRIVTRVPGHGAQLFRVGKIRD